ncbi:hypothetical protein [Microbacterium sp. SA39]|uniref:hypothetical protein n=1 Tax=Microbacterium sp. SA39 TaxID=1263625 RepID=UPI00061FC038|nr:hypothetical protein [Microbacterium sp. SA39]KJQ56130.1 hypothetical protein RS85_00015 [Microbacterium sp. SA39]
MTETRQNKVRTKPFIILLAALICGLIVFGVWLVTRDSRENLTISAIAESANQTDGYASEALDGLEEDTATLCRGVSGCVEGYASPTVELLRFDSKEGAAEFSSENVGSYQSDWIVVVYTDGSLSDSGRQEVEDLIDSMWKSESARSQFSQKVGRGSLEIGFTGSGAISC